MTPSPSAHAELILAAIADLKEDVSEVKEHLATLNGRTRKIETASAIQWVLWVLAGGAVAAIVPWGLEHLRWT